MSDEDYGRGYRHGFIHGRISRDVTESNTPLIDRMSAALEDEFFKVREFGTDRGIITPERIAAKALEVTQDNIRIKELVDRFLAWPLPKGHASDGCASDPNYQYPRYGTHLLTAAEATEMFQYLFNAEPKE